MNDKVDEMEKSLNAIKESSEKQRSFEFELRKKFEGWWADRKTLPTSDFIVLRPTRVSAITTVAVILYQQSVDKKNWREVAVTLAFSLDEVSKIVERYNFNSTYQENIKLPLYD
jgi:hypothetical protein